MANKDRRINERVPARFKVNYVDVGDYLISYSKDLSVDGMFVYTENPPAVGEEVKLVFSLGDLREVAVKARVTWTNRKKSENDKNAGMGVQFLGLNSDIRAQILQIVNRILVGDKKTFCIEN